MVGRGDEELRQEQEEIRQWDAVIVETCGPFPGRDRGAANLKRKHRLGTAILQIYRMIGIYLRGGRPEDVHLARITRT